MNKTNIRPLRISPFAWAKLLYLRDLGNTEVGGFGVSSADDLLLVVDICLINQFCTEVTVRLDDQAVADYFDLQVDAGVPPERFGRIWIHTHPGKSPQPSKTDEETFARCFGDSDWAVMFILSRGGQSYARLRLKAGPGAEVILPVEVDFTCDFAASVKPAWEAEYQQFVHLDQPLGCLPLAECWRAGGISHQRGKGAELRDPCLADPCWDDQAAFYSYLESLDDRDRHPF